MICRSNALPQPVRSMRRLPFMLGGCWSQEAKSLPRQKASRSVQCAGEVSPPPTGEAYFPRVDVLVAFGAKMEKLALRALSRRFIDARRAYKVSSASHYITSHHITSLPVLALFWYARPAVCRPRHAVVFMVYESWSTSHGLRVLHPPPPPASNLHRSEIGPPPNQELPAIPAHRKRQKHKNVFPT